MKKISLDLLTLNSGDDFDAFTPILWVTEVGISGGKFQLEPSLNIRRLKNELVSASANINADLQELIEVGVSTNRLKRDVGELEDSVVGLNKVLNSLGATLSNYVTLNESHVSHARIELALYKLMHKLKTNVPLVSQVRSGNTISFIGTNRVPVSYDYEKVRYSLGIGEQADLGYIRGDNTTIYVYHSAAQNNYHFNTVDQRLGERLRSSANIKVELVNGYAVITANPLKQALHNEDTNNLVTVDNLGKPSLDFAPNFLVATPNKGLTVKMNGAGQYVVGLDSLVSDVLERKITASSGLFFTGDRLNVDRSFIPKLVAGSGVELLRSGLNSFRLKLDRTLIPKKRLITANYPYRAVEVNGGETKFDIDPTFSVGLQSRIDNTERLISQAGSEFGKLDPIKFGKPFHESWALPLTRLSRVMLGDYANSGLTKSSSRIQALLNEFGTRPYMFTIRSEVKPYIVATDVGSGVQSDRPIKVDTYLILEQWLRQRLGIPNFTITQGERGTTFKAVDLGAESSAIKHEAPTSLPRMHYNMQFNVEAVNGWASNAVYQNATGVTCSPARLRSYMSSNYVGLPLMITAGDCDFTSGTARNGQVNNKPLTFPSDLTEAVKLRIVEHSVVTAQSNSVFNLKISDEYTGETYSCQVSRKVGTAINAGLDYITEIIGKNNPDHVRLYARLFTNWGLGDTDLNRILYFLGQDNGCLAKFAGNLIHEGVTKGLWASDLISGSDAVKNSEFEVVVGDLVDGKAEVTLRTIGNLGSARFGVDHLLRSVDLTVTYVISLSHDQLFDKADLFAGTCFEGVETGDLPDVNDCGQSMLGLAMSGFGQTMKLRTKQ